MASRRQQPIIISVFILGVSILMAAVYFMSDLNSPLLFLIKAILQPVSFVVLAVFVCVAIWSKNKLVSLVTIFGCLINTPFLLPNILSGQVDQKSDASIKVATFSTLTRTKNVDDITSFVESEGLDLVCLQEVSADHRKTLIEKLDGAYPYIVESGNNQLVLSQYELIADKDIGYYHISTLKHPQWGEIKVINAHMSRPYRTRGISKEWRELFDELDNELPTILCGDLNITPNNTHYELLRFNYQLNDAHSSGYGFTYPSAQRRSALFGVLIRIDYILSRGFHSFNTRTHNASPLSDHRAVISHLEFIQTK